MTMKKQTHWWGGRLYVLACVNAILAQVQQMLAQRTMEMTPSLHVDREYRNDQVGTTGRE